MAVHAQQLDTAEMALAAIEEVDKLQYIQSIKRIPSVEGRSAELTLYNRRPDDAEQILLQVRLRQASVLYPYPPFSLSHRTPHPNPPSPHAYKTNFTPSCAT
jgi:hypothetical protein